MFSWDSCMSSYGSARLCSSQLGSARLCSALLGSARLCSALLGSDRFCSALLGIVRLYWYTDIVLLNTLWIVKPLISYRKMQGYILFHFGQSRQQPALIVQWFVCLWVNLINMYPRVAGYSVGFVQKVLLIYYVGSKKKVHIWSYYRFESIRWFLLLWRRPSFCV